MGFHQVDRGLLPLKVWKDCLSCPKFECCDEIAVLKALRFDTVPALPLSFGEELIQLPKPQARLTSSCNFKLSFQNSMAS